MNPESNQNYRMYRLRSSLNLVGRIPRISLPPHLLQRTGEFEKMLHDKEREHNKVLWEMYKSEADARLELQKFVKEQFGNGMHISTVGKSERFSQHHYEMELE